MIRQPASVIVAGPSGSGKSELVEKLLKEKTLFHPPSEKNSVLLRQMANQIRPNEKTNDVLQRTSS